MTKEGEGCYIPLRKATQQDLISNHSSEENNWRHSIDSNVKLCFFCLSEPVLHIKAQVGWQLIPTMNQRTHITTKIRYFTWMTATISAFVSLFIWPSGEKGFEFQLLWFESRRLIKAICGHDILGKRAFILLHPFFHIPYSISSFMY